MLFYLLTRPTFKNGRLITKDIFMATTAKTTKKKVFKKATKKVNNANTTAPIRASITLGQVNTLVKFYEKNNVKVPAFLAKLV